MEWGARDFSQKNCIEFAGVNSTTTCKTKVIIQQNQVSDLYFSENSGSKHLVLVNPEDPIAFAGAYYLLKNKAVPYINWTASKTADTIKSEMLSFLTAKNWKPQFITIIGHHNYLAGFALHASNGGQTIPYVSDYGYSKLDSGAYHLVNLGRIVALQLPEALQQINRTFYYSFLNTSSRHKAAIHSCDTGDTGECFRTNQAFARTLKGYLESKGFVVDFALNQNKSKFIQQLTANELVFKGNHGNISLTSIYGDTDFEAKEFPVMNPAIYITLSCFTANYYLAKTSSAIMLLSHIERGGVAYLGASSPGLILHTRSYSFLTKNSTLSEVRSGPTMGSSEGYSYYGDPTFKLNYPPDTPSAISAQLTTVDSTTKKLLVQIPTNEFIKFADLGYLPLSFDKIASDSNAAWGIQTVRFTVEDTLTQVSQVTLSQHEMETGKVLPAFNNCKIDEGSTGSSNGSQVIHCYRFTSEAKGVVLSYFYRNGVGGANIVACDIDKTDFLENKTELVCDILAPFLPLNLTTKEVAKVLSFSVDIKF